MTSVRIMILCNQTFRSKKINFKYINFLYIVSTCRGKHEIVSFLFFLFIILVLPLQHFRNMDSTWGAFGGGAPKHMQIRKKANLTNSLFYPELSQVGLPSR